MATRKFDRLNAPAFAVATAITERPFAEIKILLFSRKGALSAFCEALPHAGKFQ